MKAKNNYTLRITNKLGDPKAAPRTYWPIFNRFFYNKKFQQSPPPFLVNGRFFSEFCFKANLFNDFFASICTKINNGGTMPPFTYKTNIRINFFRRNHNDISIIIKI